MLEITNCYKCDSAVTAPVGVVHPLCDNCDDDFQKWFAEVTNWDKQL